MLPAEPIDPPKTFTGSPDSLSLAVVATVNPDNTVDTRSAVGRGGKAGVLIPDWYLPTIGDRVLVADLDGDLQRPVVVQYLYSKTGPGAGPNARFAGLVGPGTNPIGAASGDLGGNYPGPTVVQARSGFTINAVLAVVTTDSRLSDARTPTGAAGGDLGSSYPLPTVVKAQAGFTIGGVLAVVTTDSRLSDARTPLAHHATHEPGGSDPMAVDAAAATGSLRTLGTGAQQALPGSTAIAPFNQRGTYAARPAPAAGNSGEIYLVADLVFPGGGGGFTFPSDGSGIKFGALDGVAYESDGVAWNIISGTPLSDPRLQLEAGTLANRPAANMRPGLPYLATDVNGGTLYRSDGTSWTQVTAGVLIPDSALASPNNAVRKLIHEAGVSFGSPAAAGTFIYQLTGSGQVSGANTNGAYVFHFDPASHAVAGKTTQLIIKSSLFTNATAPGNNYTTGISAITGVAGGAGGIAYTFGAATGNTVVVNAPAASSRFNAETAAFAAPAAGYYGPTTALSGVIAANGWVTVFTQVYVVNI